MAIVTSEHPIPPPAGVLDRVLCVVDDGPASADAVREAIAVGPCAGRLDFIAVTGDISGAASSLPLIDRRRARHALELAQAQAAAHGVRAGIQLVEAPDVAHALIARAGDHDLLVTGMPANSRVADAATSSIATVLADRAVGPVLFARGGGRPRGAAPRILVAVDDSAAATEVVRMAGAIAVARGGYVHLIHVQGRGYGPRTRHRLAELSLELMTITAAEPVVDVLRGARVAESIAEFARRCDASQLVVGRRGLSGLRALGSLSDRLVHAAPCSVLVVSAR
jgi:nucleotide-binding universal stress UspA family protein